MIIKNESSYGNSSKDYSFFIENYEKIKPLKALNVFFDDENFLLTDYNASKGTTFVAEGWNGNQIHLTGLNCGYGGEGPSRTQDVLIFLGLSHELAFNLKHYPGLQFKFDENGVLLEKEISHNAFFSSQGNTECEVKLDSFTYVEYETNSLYFVNPQIHNPQAIYSAIEKLKPFDFQYYIGTESPLNTYYRPDTEFTSLEFKDEVRSNITGINLILRCISMDLLFLIDKRVAHSFVNMIHYYIFKKPLFNDDNYGEVPKFYSYLSRLLTNRKQERSGTINVDKKEKQNENQVYSTYTYSNNGITVHRLR